MRSLLLLLVCGLLGAGAGFAQPGHFVRVVEDRLELGTTGETVWLRGMGVGNYVFEGVTDPDTLYMHHDSTLYRDLAASGMTAVRFNYRCDAFETAPYTYSEEAFGWLADNARWAGQEGIWLIPVAMALPGSVPGDASGFWDDPDNQQRLAALWAEMAGRFAEETAIGAWDLLNEPIPTQSAQQWTDLAQSLVDTIRTVDSNHVVLLEPLYGVLGDWDGDPDNPEDVFFLVEDANVLYDVHFYRPHAYTQWYRFSPDRPHWPDPRPVHLPHDARWLAGTSSNPSPPAGSSDWAFYIGNFFFVDDPAIALGALTLQSGQNSGTAWFDDVLLTRHNPAGGLLDTVYREQISSTEDWLYAWRSYGAKLRGCDTTGYGDDYSLLVDSAAAWGGWSSRTSRFPVQQNSTYRASSAIKAQDMPEEGFAICRVDFYSNPSGSGLLPWDRGYLQGELDRWTQFGQLHGVPMNIGEFGVDDDLFEGHGALLWIEQMLEEMIARDLHFTYHLYDLVQNRPEVFDTFAAALQGQAVEADPEDSPAPRGSLALRPNPTNDRTVASFSLPRAASPRLLLHDRLGRRVRSYAPGRLAPGPHSCPLDLGGLPAGVYLLSLEAEDRRLASRRLVLVK